MAAFTAAFLLPLLLVLGAVNVFAVTLEPRTTTVPAPLAFTPDEYWDGIDGSWSTFFVQVGTPAQTLRVLVSWINYQTWVVHPEGCTSGSTYSTCANARGGVFYMNESSTWDNVGLYSLYIEENLGLEGNAKYGFDVVTLGGLGDNGPTLKNTTVGDFAVTDFYLGYFGLNPKPTNWSSFEQSSPSYMTQLKEQDYIPSVSFGYTAGAEYRFTGVLASLTLGGYDSSRFVSNDVEITFAADNSRDTVIGIQNITSPTSSSDAEIALMPTPFYALVDATVAELWLPLDTCQSIETQFGLVYDNTTELYLVNDTLHEVLLQQNASIKFTIGQSSSGGSSVDIVLPYASFDLTASPPYQGLQNSSRYFPLRRAANSTQYTIGRVFFQEAYITVNYETSKFNISQCSWVQNAQSTLVAIPASNSSTSANATSTSTTTISSSSSVSTGAIAGIAVGAALLIGLIVGLAIWRVARKRNQRRQAESAGLRAASSSAGKSDLSSGSDEYSVAAGLNEKGTNVIPKAELEGSSGLRDDKKLLSPGGYSTAPNTPNSPSSQGYGTYNPERTYINPTSPHGAWGGEADGVQIYEMPGDMPETAQADGKEMTEKDMMQRREDKYNGVDQNRPAIDAAQTQETPRERVAVQADQVREAQGNEGGKRFSFANGDDRTLTP